LQPFNDLPSAQLGPRVIVEGGRIGFRLARSLPGCRIDVIASPGMERWPRGGGVADAHVR
jgi:hypothetical protein